jgi:protein TonB
MAAKALEDLVYRASLVEGDPALRRADYRLTVPIALGLCGAFLGLGAFLGRGSGAARPEPRTVDLVLQEGLPGPEHGPGGAAPAPRPRVPAPALAPAPAPAAAPREAPAPPPPISQETVPDQAPRDLPREDNSSLYAGQAGAPGGTGTGTGTGAGAGSGGAGRGAGDGTGGGGARHAPRVVDLNFTQVRVVFQPQPPAYPTLARMARIQGTVVVQILVGVDGVPFKAQAVEGPSQLRATAETYGLAWRFAPYLQNGVPMISRFNLIVTFRLTG